MTHWLRVAALIGYPEVIPDRPFAQENAMSLQFPGDVN
jgi:hypothetical protein